MFRGEYSHSIDDKGRVIIPVKYREKLGARFYATRGADNCVCLYPCAEWEKIESQLCSLVTTKPKERAFVRMMTSSVADCEINGQGRVTLPPHLRAYAGLQKDVTLIGNLTHVELWDKTAWELYNESLRQLGEMPETWLDTLASDLEIRL
ncbi:MAG: division/cell wall cluster transcriptional repressor MraZ [Gracilibacteraceae bacterium]|jgi:MraZ protein|nr:division/cell wall cluster transcriptional repressor MraZ [Gracilibacteraceae bacterium]